MIDYQNEGEKEWCRGRRIENAEMCY